MSGRDGEPAGLSSTFGPAAATKAVLPAATIRNGAATWNGGATRDDAETRDDAATRDDDATRAEGTDATAPADRVDITAPTPQEEPTTEPEQDERGPVEAARPSDGPSRRGRSRSPRAKGIPRAQGRRAPRPVVVRDPRQVDMILLAVLEHAPRSRAELLDLITSRSLGRFVPARDQVTHRLIYLERNRLLVRSPGQRRYRVTDLGVRVLNGRVRAWRQFVDGMDALIDG
ncbi:MAG: PadR family transcriptional regulator [Pseudonocardia sp.]|uniref:PadR family transcriptional regulator n=1 Tax=Pseudonocardia sp. TaxID=60912 RepID=UPI003D0CE58B